MVGNTRASFLGATLVGSLRQMLILSIGSYHRRGVSCHRSLPFSFLTFYSSFQDGGCLALAPSAQEKAHECSKYLSLVYL